MTDNLPAVSIVVPVLNGAKTIESCLKSLLYMDYPQDRMEILVIDNGSTDNTSTLVSQYPVQCYHEHREGLSYARNLGISSSTHNYIGFIDSDCMASRSWIKEIMKSFCNDETALSLGEVVTFPSKNQIENYTAIRKSKWQTRNMKYPECPWFLSNCVVFKKEVFDEVGFYDTRFAGMGCEDIDFSWRFFSSGKYGFKFQPRAVLFHKHRSSLGGLFKQYYRYGKGQYILSRKHSDIISWNLGNEISAYKDLFHSILELFNKRECSIPENTIMNHFNFKLYDLVRKIAERIGFTYAFMRGYQG